MSLLAWRLYQEKNLTVHNGTQEELNQLVDRLLVENYKNIGQMFADNMKR